MQTLKYQHIDELPGLTISETKMSNMQFAPHFHLEFHIGLVHQGELKQSVRGLQMNLTPGQICIVPPGEVHDGYYKQDESKQNRFGDYELSTFRISSELIQEVFSDGEIGREHIKVEDFIGSTIIETSHLSKRFEYLKNVFAPENMASQLHKDTLWQETIFELLSQLYKLPQSKVKLEGLNHHQLDQIKQFSKSNLHRKINLDELASLVNLSRFQFIRRFQKSVGIAPHAWLTHLRLASACQLLRRPNAIIADIAAVVGFYDQSHFNRAFKKAYKVSPSQYRIGN